MSEKTEIQWADATFNPWVGCTKWSPGCKFCYAEASIPARTGHIPWGPGKPRKRNSQSYWQKAEQWDRWAKRSGVRTKVFPSLCDPFDDEVPLDWFRDFMLLVSRTPNLDWLLLTKRPENIVPRMNKISFWPSAPEGFMWSFMENLPNVWLGVSAESQAYLSHRTQVLLSIPATLHFVSAEPLLDALDVEPYFSFVDGDGLNEPLHEHKGLDWVIVGGESRGGRPCKVEWIEGIVAQCQSAGVPVFVKQLGSNPVFGEEEAPYRCDHRKGGNPEEWPMHLRVREFPKTGTRFESSVNVD